MTSKSNTTKRKIDIDECNNEFRPIKRVKHEEGDDDDVDEEDEAVRNGGGEFCDDPLNFKACRFQCPICSKECICASALMNHVNAKHRKSDGGEKYSWRKDLKVKDCLTLTLWHKCRIDGCQMESLSDERYLRGHLRTHHNCNLNEYKSLIIQQFQAMNNNSNSLVTTDDDDDDNDDDTNEDEDESYVLSEKFKRKSPLILVCLEVENCNIFQCDKCDFEVEDSLTFSDHHSTEHGEELPPKEVINYAGGNAVWHPCRLCPGERLILCDARIIADHVEKRHNDVDMNDYEVNLTPRMPQGKKMIRITLEDGVKISRRLTDAVLFKCETCDAVKNSEQKMRNHIRRHHFEEAEIESFESLPNPIYYECQVENCESKYIRASREQINYHVDEEHHLKPAEYNKMVEKSKNPDIETKIDFKVKQEIKQEFSNDQDFVAVLNGVKCTTSVIDLEQRDFKCSFCDFSCENSVMFQNHMARDHKKTSIWIQDYLAEEMFHKCKVCGLLIKCQKVEIFKHALDEHSILAEGYQKLPVFPTEAKMDHVSDEGERVKNGKFMSATIANKCGFECPLCRFRAASYSIIQDHLAGNHHGDSQREAVVSKSVFIRCVLCKSDVLCDRVIFTNHIQNEHQDDFLQSVVQEFVDKNVKKIY